MNRQAFEDQIRKQFPKADDELLTGRRVIDGRYASMVTEHAWLAWQAAKATCPAWHDAPTVPGLWVSSVWNARYFSLGDIANFHNRAKSPRWYGPIQEDKI